MQLSPEEALYLLWCATDDERLYDARCPKPLTPEHITQLLNDLERLSKNAA